MPNYKNAPGQGTRYTSDVKLSANFRSQEFNGGRASAWRVHPLLVQALQALRVSVGRPVRIRNGYGQPLLAGEPYRGESYNGTGVAIQIDGFSAAQTAVAAHLVGFAGITVSGERVVVGVGRSYRIGMPTTPPGGTSSTTPTGTPSRTGTDCAAKHPNNRIFRTMCEWLQPIKPGLDRANDAAGNVLDAAYGAINGTAKAVEETSDLIQNTPGAIGSVVKWGFTAVVAVAGFRLLASRPRTRR